jgi:hypothetical protein
VVEGSEERLGRCGRGKEHGSSGKSGREKG